jgi:DNA-binding NarL/FixJ family response regulator
MHHVLVIEPHLLMRRGLAALIDQLPAHRVVAEVADPAQTLAQTDSWRPTLVVYGWDGRDDGAGGTLRALVQRPQPPRVLVLLPSERLLDGTRMALQAGCDGVVCKDLSRESLERAVLDLSHGRSHVEARLSRLLATADAAPRPPALAALTARENEVFRLVAQGHTNRSAAQALGLSAKTVEKHRALVMRKLDLRHAVELLLVARDLGLPIRPGEPPDPRSASD